MITKDLIIRIFSAANILRWNDHVRPFDFVELDKQAHKMIIAYILAKFEEDSGNVVDWQKLIEGGIFEFFQRINLELHATSLIRPISIPGCPECFDKH